MILCRDILQQVCYGSVSMLSYWILPYTKELLHSGCEMISPFPHITYNEALLGGVYAPCSPALRLPRSPCSLPFFGARSYVPIFTAPFSSLFAPCSFLFFPLAP